jgi:hypothetical protein
VPGSDPMPVAVPGGQYFALASSLTTAVYQARRGPGGVAQPGRPSATSVSLTDFVTPPRQ